MNIDDLTIKEARQISNLFSNQNKTNLLSNAVGEYVIVRSINEGVNAGTVLKADETGVVLSNARRLHYHKPKDKKMAWYEGVAISGLSDDCKVSEPVFVKYIIEDYSLTICHEAAKQSIINYESYHG